MNQSLLPPLILIGGGGHCRSIIDVAECAGRRIFGIIDRDSDSVGTEVLGYPVIGVDADLPNLINEGEFLISCGCITVFDARIRSYSNIKSLGGRLATLIAPDAIVSRHATIGEGTVVMHGAIVNAASTIAENCIINTGSIIEHDCHIGRHTHISTSATINGGCSVGEATLIGSGATLRQGVKVNSGIIVGASALVINDLEAPGIYVGVPAIRRI